MLWRRRVKTMVIDSKRKRWNIIKAGLEIYSKSAGKLGKHLYTNETD